MKSVLLKPFARLCSKAYVTSHGFVPGLFIARVALIIDLSALFVKNFVVTATSRRQSKTSSHTRCLFSRLAR
jgi:hypothetical protein